MSFPSTYSNVTYKFGLTRTSSDGDRMRGKGDGLSCSNRLDLPRSDR